ncbi:MAG: hypothetical protein DWQ19_09520 [Crenarchaeota archaeon]|nr:MAG: hypothetical protein DWQ19_09520 [Thermoproteota archaeon]
MNATKELEKWKNEHKSHAVSISHDDGYGAICGWEVILYIHGEKIVAIENASRCHESETCVVLTDPDEGNDSNWDDDWPGLEKTILAAIKCARKFKEKQNESSN